MADYLANSYSIGRSEGPMSVLTARSVSLDADFLTIGALIVLPITHYHKRAWRAESSAYVVWDTTDPVEAYPGGGTLTPALGVVVYTWTT